MGTIVDNDHGFGPVIATKRLYTLNEDFEHGRRFNVHHDEPGNQLQLTEEIVPFPYIWIATTNRGTITKIDTRTGSILGEYSTNPDSDSASFPSPSRTTVALDGSVWAANRGDRSVIHVGLVEEGQCVDRNGNGFIETSTGYGDILPWPNPGGVDSEGGVSTAQDECVKHYLKVAASGTRHLSIDADNNIWVSGRFGTNNAVFQLIDGETAEILRTEGPFDCGGYGGLIDRNGIIWSSNQRGAVLRWDPDVSPPTSQSLKCIAWHNDWRYSYGLAVASDGTIWGSGLDGDIIWRIPHGGTELERHRYRHGSWHAQGLAIDRNDHIWVSSALNGGRPHIGHVLPNGTFLGNVSGVGVGSTGVAVDAAGKIWTANLVASTVSRIDPDAGPIGSDGVTRLGAVDLTVSLPGARPYNYSDMTGFLALQKSSPRGTWIIIQDGGEAGTSWGTVTWNTEPEASVPAGASITVEARAADVVAGLGGQPFLAVDNGVGFNLSGRFIEVRAILRPNLADESPVLSDILICTADLNLPTLAIDDVVVSEGDTGSVVAQFHVTLSVPSAEEILVDFATIDGNALAGSDYLSRTGRLAFPPGTTSQQLSIVVLSDLLDEPNETFAVNLSLPRGAALGDGQGIGTIVDDDPSVALSLSNVTVEEGDPLPDGSGTVNAVFDVTLDGPSSRTVRIDYLTADVTAEVGVDYQEAFGYLELPPGTTSATVTVVVFGDLEPEDDETFLLLLQNPDGAVLVTSEAICTILDDDARELSIDDVTVEEGDDGTVEATFTVSLSRASNRAVSFDYATADGTATSTPGGDGDYLETGGTVTLEVGEVEAPVSVLVAGDVLLENDETFTVELSNPVEAILIDAEGLGTILDDEACPGPNLLANPSAELRPVDGQLPGWTPLADTTWQRRRFALPEPVDGDATFFPGAQELAELWQDIDVGAYASLIDDGVQVFEFEGFVRTFDETPPDVAQIVLEYRDADNLQVLDSFDSGEISSIFEWQRATDLRTAPEGTRILRLRLIATRFTEGDNDAYFDALSLRSLRAATLSVDDLEIYEGVAAAGGGGDGDSDSGGDSEPGDGPAGVPVTVEAVFTVRLSCPIDSTVTIDYATADGTAVEFEDYLATAGQLVFEPGVTALPVAVPVVGDGVDEPTEVFYLDLLAVATDSELVVTLDPRGDGRILDDDFCPRSPGFWKTHTGDWPVDYLELGGGEVEAPELLDFLEYRGPDAATKLARQLVATKLNLAAGSDPYILPTVETADLFLIDFPPGSNPRGEDKQTAQALKNELDAYNNLDCAEGPVIAGLTAPILTAVVARPVGR